jgi:Recombination endonuclease VII
MTKINQRRNRQLKKKYGIDLKQWNTMFKRQGGICPICLRHQSELKTRLCVDHNHKTKEVRALICTYCNFRRVGKLNKKWAKAVYEYLQKYDTQDEN